MLSLPIYTHPTQTGTHRRDPLQLAFDHHWSELAPLHLDRLALLRAIWAPLLRASTCPQRTGWLAFGLDQFERGFHPRYMLTYHYRSPEETGCTLRPRPGAATRRPVPRPGAGGTLRRYQAIERQRQDLDAVSTNACRVRAVLHRVFRRGTPRAQRLVLPLLFWHEHGRAGLGYHTHLLLPHPPGPVLSAGELEQVWRSRVVPRVKTLSPARSGCDVLPLPDLGTALGQLIYVTKEASPTHNPFDCHASVCLPR